MDKAKVVVLLPLIFIAIILQRVGEAMAAEVRPKVAWVVYITAARFAVAPRKFDNGVGFSNG